MADAFIALDPRSMSMGGAGVATTRPYNATFFNPARLAGTPFPGISRPSGFFARGFLGGRLIDRDGFLDSLETFQENDNSARLSEALDDLETAIRSMDVDREDFRNVTLSANALLDDYQSLSDKPLRGAGSLGWTVGYSSRNQGFAVFHRRNLVGGLEIRLSDEDVRALRSVVDFIDQLVDISETREIPPDIAIPRPVDGFTSEFGAQGALVTETGISMAFRFVDSPRTLFGISMKRLEVDTFDWVTGVDDAERDNFVFDDHRATYSGGNIDVGLIREVGNNWTAGLMVRNLLPEEYHTVRGNKIVLRPNVRAGIGWQTRRFSVAFDTDLNRTPAIGFDPAKQHTAIGLEYRPWRWLAFRGGYRHEHVLEEGSPSVGVGIGGRYGHFDLAVSTDTGDSFGAAIQFGLRF